MSHLYVFPQTTFSLFSLQWRKRWCQTSLSYSGACQAGSSSPGWLWCQVLLNSPSKYLLNPSVHLPFSASAELKPFFFPTSFLHCLGSVWIPPLVEASPPLSSHILFFLLETCSHCLARDGLHSQFACPPPPPMTELHHHIQPCYFVLKCLCKWKRNIVLYSPMVMRLVP